MIRLLLCIPESDAELLATTLAAQPEIDVVAAAPTGEEALAHAFADPPDVLAIDASTPGAVVTAERARDLLPDVRVIAFADDEHAGLRDAGVSAIVAKTAPLPELEEAIAGAAVPFLTLAHNLNSSATRCPTSTLIARELAELSGAFFAATYLEDEEGELEPAGIAGIASSRHLVVTPEVVRRAVSDRASAWADVSELGELYRLGVPTPQALAVPLVADGEVLGAVLVAMPANIQLELDADLVEGVAKLATASLAAERRAAVTLAEARRDPLTGLGNRRAFDEHLEHGLRGLREDDQLTLVLLDLDGFKQTNDGEGHLVGDEILREVGRVLLRIVRIDEEVFRLGGDEFAIVVQGDKEAGAEVARRVREALAGQRRGAALPTTSGGVASAPADARGATDLVRRADVALYAAKAAGKNRAVLYMPTLTAGWEPELESRAYEAPALVAVPRPDVRILVVDDDPGLRMLLRTSFELVDIEVDEAEDARGARTKIAKLRPDVIVLDIGLPGTNGLELCRELKAAPATSSIGVVLLTGVDDVDDRIARESGADALLRKPFSPLELLSVVERLAGGLSGGPFQSSAGRPPEEQLLLYAHDLRRLLEIERLQRLGLQQAYTQTVETLASALESRDSGTGEHSTRVQRYAIELTRAIQPRLLDDPSLGYGFLLHDIGKIGIPDRILGKPGPLLPDERRLMETHPILGERLLSGIALLEGEGLRVVRSHHERWDGSGYPDRLHGVEVPLGARIFAVADALDAMTSTRAYRRAVSWEVAAHEIFGQAGRQFDPDVVDAFLEREATLRDLSQEALKQPVA